MVVKPLEGIRVADFSWVAAGPISTKYLAILGAEVIKIESSRRPDTLRRLGNTAHPTVNYSKRGCTLNITEPKGIDLAKDIIKKSDVVIDNFAYGVMDRLGLGYEALREIKPDIIVVSAAGLGKTGPHKEHVAFGMLVESYSGLHGITGYEGGPPRDLGSPWSDPLNGCYLTLAMLAALKHHKCTGEGQYIEFSMAEVVSAQLPEAILDYTVHGNVWEPRGNIEEGASPHNCYPCLGEDKWVAIAVTTEDEWSRFCVAIGNPEWCHDEQFADRYRRFQHRQELDRLVGEWTVHRTPQEVMEILQAANIPAGPSHNAKELVEDPNFQEQGFYVPIEMPDGGEVLMAGLPWRMHPNPAGYKYEKVPQLGGDNGYVFGDLLGLSKNEIETLIEQGVIY